MAFWYITLLPILRFPAGEASGIWAVGNSGHDVLDEHEVASLAFVFSLRCVVRSRTGGTSVPMSVTVLEVEPSGEEACMSASVTILDI